MKSDKDKSSFLRGPLYKFKTRWKEDWFLTMMDYVLMPMVITVAALFFLLLFVSGTVYEMALGMLIIRLAQIAFAVLLVVCGALLMHNIRS